MCFEATQGTNGLNKIGDDKYCNSFDSVNS